MSAPVAAIVDYGVGNLFSVAQACAAAGFAPLTTSSGAEIRRADAVILPGIGAFGDAMTALAQLDLVQTLRDVARDGIPLLGVCLGMQLLMEQSHEFGTHEGLGLVAGSADGLSPSDPRAKVPHVGWSGLNRPAGRDNDAWAGSVLDGVPDGVPMYFVHGYAVRPADPGVVLAVTRYGGVEFCSALRTGAITAFQCHPERSGPRGLQVYQNFARDVLRRRNAR